MACAWLPADPPGRGQLIVVFLHNVASGHERTIRPAGPNNTGPGCWQHFLQQCLLVTDMTFDEARFEWHDMNQNAAGLVANALNTIAAKNAGSRSSQESLTENDAAVRASRIR